MVKGGKQAERERGKVVKGGRKLEEKEEKWLREEKN